MIELLWIVLILLILYLLSLRGRSGYPGVEKLRGWSYAHRGLHGAGVPEKSMAAFRKAMEHGYGAELDVHLLRVGGLAVILDSLLKRTTGLDGRVEELTTEQLRDIYAGKITNWKEVGGNDAPILPFQRNADAGSQSLMKKLVMGDTPFMEAPTEYVVGSMMGLMEAVKSYDNSANAIGYSVYYYANEMRMAQGLKILKVNGVEPNGETIRSGAYAHTNAYYCAISAATAEDDPARILYRWLLSPQGQ